ncbi:hypothetical protein N7530_013025 [Penicillium desertorum]|uniref:Uncharacterized protein n=1 Tax=Penicillium desertorum TaxID=1303715 RepID=A0A9W9WDC4_9EURO|nr:hypothetical protein N7530_013025 [Penicillium desertorum]
MRPRANWPVCPPEPTAAPPITSPAPSPTPHAGGLLYTAPPPKPPVPGPPGKVAPFDPPFPPSRSANWRIRKIAISSAPSRGPLHRPPWGEGACSKAPPPPSKAEGAPPCVHPGPRASRAGFASPPLHLPSTPPAGAANSPAAPTGAPRPLPRAAKHRRPPSPGAGGGGTAGGAWLRGDRRAGGVVPRGSPCQGPHPTLADPHSLSPGPLGPGRFYTDSPTPFGV